MSDIAVLAPRKGSYESPYIASLEDEMIKIFAVSPAQAKQKAIEHFKPKKKQRDHLKVERI